MTRVLANLSWLVPGAIGGAEEYTVRLLRAVAVEAHDGIDVELAGPVGLRLAHPDLTEAFPTRLYRGPAAHRPYRVATESTWLRRVTDGADLVHHFGGRLPGRRTEPSVVTIHDVQPLDLPENFSPLKRAYLSRALPRTTDGARIICTPSTWSAERIVDRLGVEPDKMRVVPSTWDDTADALFISCMNLDGIAAAQALEERIGKPVITSHTATLWRALRWR